LKSPRFLSQMTTLTSDLEGDEPLTSDYGAGEPTTTRSPSESTEKWYILCAATIVWCASYFCILCPGPLMDDMMRAFDLSNTEFASLGTISFGSAVIGSLLAIALLRCASLYRTMLISCVCLLCGQSIFAVGVWVHNGRVLDIQYFGRVLIGVAYGVHNVTVYSCVTLWFAESKWLAFALHTVNNSFEVAVLLGRYAMPALYAITQRLYVPFLLGVALAAVSIAASFLMIRIDKNFANEPVVLDTDLTKMKKLSRTSWMLLVMAIIGWASYETFGSQFTLPLMVDFGVDETTVDMLMSMAPIYALTIAQFFAWAISKYGHVSYFAMLGTALMTMGMLMAFLSNVFAWQDISSLAMVICLIFAYVVGTHFFFAAGYTCLFMSVPVEGVSVTNTVLSMGAMLGSMAQSWLFGFIADETGSYTWSIFMCFALLAVALVLIVAVHTLDVWEDGPLHKPSQAAKYECIVDSPEEEKSLLHTDDIFISPMKLDDDDDEWLA